MVRDDHEPLVFERDEHALCYRIGMPQCFLQHGQHCECISWRRCAWMPWYFQSLQWQAARPISKAVQRRLIKKKVAEGHLSSIRVLSPRCKSKVPKRRQCPNHKSKAPATSPKPRGEDKAPTTSPKPQLQVQSPATKQSHNKKTH